ncbi:PREDICTED: coiled-coil domain-containing protein 159 isoform X2 [Condylura cristata]|uniref:coiled-coil domain-containing protein 159 isoform X2 n=1 Tax=Condylura cristata TaxID=143302 RepID=UPI000642BEF7|nr:PREDICTED: coiled-coil domain-containing protein 159 isoform X2 [Condylura cristata]
MNRCDPLLAGLPRDPDYSVPCLCSSPSPSNLCLPDNGKCDKSWGSSMGNPGTGELKGARGLLAGPQEAITSPASSSDKILDYTIHWSRGSEPETLAPATSENKALTIDWRPAKGSGPGSHGSSSFLNIDSKECCNDQELLKRIHSIAKKPLEINSSKIKANKSTMVIPDSQKHLRCELESVKSQLQAQTKAFEFLNHSVTMLEKESCLQQIKLQQLEEVLSPTSHQTEKERQKCGMEQGHQELYGALAQGLQGLQKTLRDSEEVQQARTTRCLQLLAQEIRDSKKFLWEELELVREEVTFIYQKLQAQEEEITENLMNIQKMQKTQVKCRKVLTKMKQHGYDTSNWPETEEMPAGGTGSWKDDLQKELSDIWSAVHVLQNSFDDLTMPSGGHPRTMNLRGYKGHQCLSSLLPSWDSDSDSDQDPSQAPFSKNRSFPLA